MFCSLFYTKAATSGIIAISFLMTAPCYGDELDELLSGFEGEQPSSAELELDDLTGGFEVQETDQFAILHKKSAQKTQWLEIQGSLTLQSTLNFSHDAPFPGQPDYRGLSMFRGHGEIITDAQFSGWKSRIGITAFYDTAYQMNNQRDLYTSEYLDEYENEIEFNEAYIQGILSSKLDIKLGRQIVVWGKSDNIRVTDIINPLDLRYPGMADIRYLRLPVTMSRIDYYRGAWNLSALIIHEPRLNKLPVYNGEFYPFHQSGPPLETPGWTLRNQQLGFALNGIFSGWDISFYAASVFDQNSHFERDANSDLYRTHERVTMVGAAANLAMGNWLLKGETAYWDGLRYSNIQDEKSRFDALAGIEYSGFTETNISFEIANRHIFNFDPLLGSLPDGQKEDWTQFALRYVRDFMNDTLHLTFLASFYGLVGDEGGFQRLELEYDISDSLTLMGGVVFYESGDFPAFREIGDSDRLLFELEYRF